MSHLENDSHSSEQEQAFEQVFIEAARKHMWLIGDGWLDEEVMEAEKKENRKRLWASVILLGEGALLSYYLHAHNITSLQRLFTAIDQEPTLSPPFINEPGLEFIPVSLALLIFLIPYPDRFYAEVFSEIRFGVEAVIRRALEGRTK